MDIPPEVIFGVIGSLVGAIVLLWKKCNDMQKEWRTEIRNLWIRIIEMALNNNMVIDRRLPEKKKKVTEKRRKSDGLD